ncbi:Nicotinate phosphoribosyltransferase [Legionella gratiana]|uniref:Nicotinate phosphoribosyltransferase n=1 Tax=Legionella gratiana TaxID=45066 RepID=A0A378JEY9_9GAMM|nr:nicotinate phosphoribosyltransferase [Legionella gratiana]KTD10902.1 Nicotinate phosphoribosyltransferase [Legionella gratiana]STX45876.1 Nicotinate phosphoribosyltransferase [Legionella gratiana]
MFDFTGSYTDQYQLTMAQVYFLKGHENATAIFDYFFRKLPLGSGYAIFAGLTDFLKILENYHFNERDIYFLKSNGMHPKFLDYLKNFRFQGTIYASYEGDLVFPTRPVVSIEANIIEAQLIETILLNLLNFQTLIATKASRIRQVAGQCQLIDFGLRRAQGPGGYYASRAAILGGFDSTSNVRVGRDYNIPISGTMAHSFIQSYDCELSAFRDFAEIWPDNCTLLVDTYSTLESGIPNAIRVGKEMEQRGQRLQGIRLDSGDLEDLAKKSRQMLNDAGLHYVKIIASNQLDEERIKNLREQNAPIDAFGVGTSLVIGAPDAALDGVYKLAFMDEKPRIKLSESISKITLPYKKQVYRLLNDDTFLGGDVVALMNETDLGSIHSPFKRETLFAFKQYQQEPLLHKVMEKGKCLLPLKTLQEIAEYSSKRLQKLPEEFKRFENPSNYQVGLSNQLNKKRNQLIKEYKK